MVHNGAMKSPLPRQVRDRMHALRLKRGLDRSHILVRPAAARPERVLLRRAGLVLALLGLIMGVFWWDRDGLRDQLDGEISLADVVYFTAVTVTTVGYGDIVPVSPRARLIDALVVTPVRLVVWLVFLGTAYELLVQRTLEDFRMLRLQRNLSAHVIVCGFGSTGASAAAELVKQGRDPASIVVIDNDRGAADRAAAAGFTTLHGSASREEILELAGAARASAIIVCVDSDESTSLIVLTARELSQARILARVEEEENKKLMRRSGADQILALGVLGGGLLAGAVNGDLAAKFIADLVSRDGQVHLVERAPTPAEIGRPPSTIAGLVMLRRGAEAPRCGAALAETLTAPDDRLLCIEST
jgi:voltage-gated potassium channel